MYVCEKQGEARGWALCLRLSEGYVWQGKVCARHPRGRVTHEWEGVCDMQGGVWGKLNGPALGVSHGRLCGSREAVPCV